MEHKRYGGYLILQRKLGEQLLFRAGDETMLLRVDDTQLSPHGCDMLVSVTRPGSGRTSYWSVREGDTLPLCLGGAGIAVVPKAVKMHRVHIAIKAPKHVAVERPKSEEVA